MVVKLTSWTITRENENTAWTAAAESFRSRNHVAIERFRLIQPRTVFFATANDSAKAPRAL